jgi:diaminopimelate epimerase
MDNIFPLSFTKMSGTGNDFIIIDHRQGRIPPQEQSGFAAKICRRMFSVGADGMILIENSDRADFRWRFYNADGSVAEMCGNGARCAARFAYSKGMVTRKMSFETIAGIITAEICENDHVRIGMTDPFDFKDDIELTLGGACRRAAFINTGVPHAVIMVDEENVPVKEWGAEVRFHQLFRPAGTNADFVRLLSPAEILARTYERGVEDETRACGTGAVASAIVAAIRNKVRSPVSVVTSGGERLIIEFTLDRHNRATDVHLTGPARMIYTGELTAESLL